MNIFSRIKNIYKLSAYEPRALGTQPAPEGTQTIQLIKKPTEPPKFIPYKKQSPVEAIVNETPQ